MKSSEYENKWFNKKFIDSSYPFDDLQLDSLFLNTVRAIKEYD